MKKIVGVGVLALLLGFVSFAFAQDEDVSVIKGEISQIESEAGYITVGGENIYVTNDILEESGFEEGDLVELSVQETEKGLELIDYEYVFFGDEEEEEEAFSFEGLEEESEE